MSDEHEIPLTAIGMLKVRLAELQHEIDTRKAEWYRLRDDILDLLGVKRDV
jgi:hypothetical protein